MKKIILTLFFPLLIMSCSEKKTLEENNRYQIIESGDSPVYLLDTKTGTVWKNVPNSGQNYWINIGTPPTEAKTKGAKSKELNLNND